MDNLFEIRTLNYFGGHFQMMFNFPEIVPRNVYNCAVQGIMKERLFICAIFLDIKGEGVGGGYRLSG